VKAPVGIGIGLLLLALLVPSAGAQPLQDPSAGSSWPWSAPQQPHPAVARITVPQQRQGMIAFGSGTLVDANDKLGLVITNWHVVDGAAGEITVAFPDGFRSSARVLKVDRDWDLAALAIWKPAVRPVALSSQPPKPGDMLTIAGYGGQGRYRAASGRCTQYVAPGLKFPYEMIELAAVARQGDSGGPIFNSSGQLAGVLFGEGGGRTSGSYCRRVHQFLSTIAIPPGGLPARSPRGPPPATIAAAAPTNDRPVVPIQPREPQPPAPQSTYAVQEPFVPATPPRAPLLPPATTMQPTSMSPTTVQPTSLPSDSFAAPPIAMSTEPPAPAEPANRFRDVEPPTPSTALDEHSILRAWIGNGPLEQIKAALAVVGAMALVLQGLRWLRAG
jgi:hypothetical protein